jgi:3-isopropylmalate/(R)-2-methylmalate dehydratase large subunit
MRMPTKEELLRLQKNYRTDKKIGEALGGIPEYLVAYWRRKKGIPKPSFAKYSEAQVRELWERFGDDFHCGRELGISKAAFYSWRRRYNIKEKPQALKLEQLELRFGWETKMGTNGVYVEYYQTAYQKILARNSGNQTVQSQEIVRIIPDLLILQDKHFGPDIDPKIEPKCWWIKPHSLALGNPNALRGGNFLKSCFEVFRRGLVRPNHLVVTTFPELTAMGAFSASVVVLEEGAIPAALEGAIDMVVPSIIKVNVSGRIPRGLSVIDLMGFFITRLSAESFKGKMIEFSGSGIEKLSGDEKMALCYFARLAGADSAFCLFDESARKALSHLIKVNDKILFSDRTAHYEDEYLLNSVGLCNYTFLNSDLSAPRGVKEAGGIDINTIFIGGPCGGSAGILKAASDLTKGGTINQRCSCFISPLTQNDFSEALKKKAIALLADFGCQILPVGMSLDEFLTISEIEGVLLSVPDKLRRDDYKPDIIFSSAETAIAAAIQGKLV